METFSSPGVPRWGRELFFLFHRRYRHAQILATALVALGNVGMHRPAWSPPPPPEMMPSYKPKRSIPIPRLFRYPIRSGAWEAGGDRSRRLFQDRTRKSGPPDRRHVNEGRSILTTRSARRFWNLWRRDTAGEYERVENTLQTMRRRAAAPGVAEPQAALGLKCRVSRSWKISAGPNTPRPAAPFPLRSVPLPAWSIRRSWIRPANVGSLLGRESGFGQRSSGHLIYNCNELGYNMQSQGAGFAYKIQGSVSGSDSGFRIQKILPPGGTMQ